MDLSHVTAIDQHAHNLLRPAKVSPTIFRSGFTEGHHRTILSDHAQHTLFYRRSLREIAALIGCDPHEEAVIARRNELSLEELCELCLTRANLEAVLMDDGFLPDAILPIEWHDRFVGTRRLLRLEALAEELLTTCDTFDSFLDQFRGTMDPPPANVVGLKTIAAYRTGLEIHPVPRETAASAWDDWKREGGTDQPRLCNKPLIDFLVWQGMELALKHQLPVQLHTGFGDTDLDLRLANPLCLRALLEEKRFNDVPIVLLHASYPFSREAGYLASVYPQVYLDMGLAVPFLSVSGMRSTMRMLLELAPFSKLMYSSDAHFFPELYYLAAKWGRDILSTCLEETVSDGDLTAEEADEVAIGVLRDNARRLYRLDLS